jgi:hypothetical protein
MLDEDEAPNRPRQTNLRLPDPITDKDTIQDPHRRDQAKKLGVGVAGVAVAGAALHFGIGSGLGSSLLKPSSSSTPTSTDPPASNVGTIPTVTEDPVGAPPGSIWFREDLGVFRFQSDLFGVLTIAPLNQAGATWSQPDATSLTNLPILVAGVAQLPFLQMTEGGLTILPGNQYGVNTFNNVLDDTYGNMKAYGTMTASSYYGELGTATLGTEPFLFSAFASGQVLYFDGTEWTNEPLGSAAVTSLNGLVGDVSIVAGDGISVVTTTDITISAVLNGTTLLLGVSGLSLNLGNTNSWTALQTFGNYISFGGAQLDVSSLATNDLLQYNGTNWVNVLPTGLGLVNSVSNSDGTLTISPTTGSVVASLALGNPNTWTGLQTFGTDISFLNAQVSGSISTGDFLYYNGSNWVGQGLASGTGVSVSGYTISLSGNFVTSLTTESGDGITLTATNPTGLGAGYYTPSISLGGDLSGSTLSNVTVVAIDGSPVSIGTPSTNQVLVWNGSDWVNAVVPATAGVTALNTLTGALTITSPNSTLSVGTSVSDVTIDINLGNANSWSATQTFTNLYPGIKMLGPVSGPASTSSEIALLGWSGSASIGVNLFADSSGSFKVGQQGSPYNTLLTVDQSGNLNAAGTVTGSSFYGELDTATLDSVAFSFTSLTSGQVLYYNGSDWINKTLSGSGVSSLNGLTGAVTLTTPNSTLSIGTSGSDVTLDLNLSNANSWSATQTFGNYISLGGATLLVTSLTTGNILQYNGSNWVNVTAASIAVVSSVSNSDGSLTISPTTGSVVASLNVGNANTWTATQTFGNHISFGGATLNVTSLTTGNLLQYNGSNWVNVTPASIAVVSSVSNSDGTLTISPTTGSVVASLNLGNANSWTATQTFGNHISIGGASFNISSLGASQLIYYNGSNWVNSAELDNFQLDGKTFSFGALSSGQVLYYNGSNWVNEALSSVTVISLNTLTGALALTTPNSTLSIGTSGSNVTLDINLNNANTWTALQTFGNHISFGGASLNVTSLTSGNLLQYNGSNWVNVTPASIAVVSSVSNSDGSLTISPTTGAVVASLNVGNANIWTATQTFGNHISFGGAAVNVTSLTTGNLLQYNGSNWVNVTAASIAVVSSVSNSDGSLTISPTTGAVVASLNVGNANTWTATQTFGNYISIGGGAFSISGLAAGDIIYYNGSNWVNLAAGVANNGKVLEVVAGIPAWASVSVGGVSSVSNSDGSLTISPTTGAVVASLNVGYSNIWSVNQTFDSTVTFEGLASTPTAPASGYALLYGITQATHHRLAYESDEGVQLILGQDSALIGYWNSAGTLAAGNTVYVNGQHSGVPIIFQAEANSTSTVPAIGVVALSIAHDVDGWLMQSGLLAGAISVGSYSAGQRLWVDYATPGGVTGTRPVWPNLAQPVGIVLQTSGSGSVLVNISPFLGGLESGTISATFTIGPSTSQAVTLTSVGQTAQHTMSFPNNTDTLAGLGTAQSWTATQTFANNISFGGATLLVSALASGNILQYNGSNWVNVTAASIAVVSSVSNSDGSLTISPTTGAVVASLNVGHANSWTALQKFTNGDLALLGTSTGYTLLESGLTGGSNNTLTLPTTATDTLAALGTVQTWTANQTINAYLINQEKSYTAAGTTQGTATAITSQIVFITAGGATNGVILPSVPDGTSIVVNNTLGNAVLVYPNSGANIDGGSANIAITLNANLGVTYTYQSSTTTWWSTQDDVSAGNGITATHQLGGNVQVAINLNGTTLSVSSSGLSLNLASANSWSAIQTFEASGIRLLGSSTGYTTLASANSTGTNYTATFPAYTGGVVVNFTGSPSTGDILYYNGSGEYVSLGIGSAGDYLTVAAGVPAWSSAVAVSSVSNSDGSLTISPTTGAVVASLNVGHANSWSATQTFGNNISFGGAAVSMSSLATGNVVYYNGSNWVNLSLTSPNSTITVTGTTAVHGVDINLGNSNTWTATQSFRQINPSTDNTYSLGTSALRWLTVNVSSDFRVYLNASDANPVLDASYYSTTGGVVEFGVGGSTALDTYLLRTAAGILSVEYATGTPSISFVAASGGSSIRITGSSTGYTALATANTSASNYTATFPANAGTVAELNLAQNWTAVQTFGSNISFGGATVSMSSLATGNVVYYNGSNWINVALTSPNSTISITGSSTVHGVDINLSNANNWSAVQTFGNNISFGGATLSVSGLASGNTLQYNGSNWVNVTVASLGVAWSSISNPTTSLGLTMAAADTTTFTLQQTSQTGFTWTTSTLTTGVIASFASTGTALSGTVNLLSIAASGVNGNTAVVARGLNISVTNTNGTSGTNVGLYLAASGATTANYALEIHAGWLVSDAAQVWALPSNTASALQKTDGTNAYYTLNTQTGTVSTVTHTFAVGTAITAGLAAGSTFSMMSLSNFTYTDSATTTVTALQGLMLNVGTPTLNQSGGAVTITTASTVYIAAAPAAGGSVTITNAYALYIAGGATYFGGNLAFNGTSLTVGTTSAYPATIYGNVVNFEGSSAGLAGTYNIGGTPTITASLAWNGTSLNFGSSSNYPANLYGNLFTFEGSSAGLAGTYNIGGTPTITASIAWSGTSLNFGTSSAYPANVYVNTLTFEGSSAATAGTYNIGGTPTMTSSLAWNGTSLNFGTSSAYPANLYGNLFTFEGSSAGLAGTYNIGGTPTVTASLAWNGTSLNFGSSSAYPASIYAGALYLTGTGGDDIYLASGTVVGTASAAIAVSSSNITLLQYNTTTTPYTIQLGQATGAFHLQADVAEILVHISSHSLAWYDNLSTPANAMALGLTSNGAQTTSANYTLYIQHTSATSDSRLKPDFRPYHANPLDELRNVRFGEYQHLLDADLGSFRAGVAAETLPDTVTRQTPEGYYSVIQPDYTHWVVGVLKAQQDEIEKLQALVTQLQSSKKSAKRRGHP